MAKNKESAEGGEESAVLSDQEALQEIDADLKLRAELHYKSLPKEVKRKVKALKKLQFESVKIETEFFKEVNDIEIKYASRYQPLYDKRTVIVNGEIEPTDEDCAWPSDEEVEELAEDASKKMAISGGEKKEGEADSGTTQPSGDVTTAGEQPVAEVSGVPNFWLTVFNNVDIISDLIEEPDIEVLRRLQDVRCKLKTEPEPSFVLEFCFAPNEYFSNQVLTKEYFLKFEPGEDDPLGYEGPEIVKTKGCIINWKPNNNLTVKVVKKVQKHKARGDKRTITKTVKADSFFHFFSPPASAIAEVDDEDIQQQLQTDFEVGQFLREHVIPRAVLYFTGEALEDDFEDETTDEEEEEDYDSDENEEAEEHHEHHGGARRGGGVQGHRGGRGGRGGHGHAADQPECKTQ